MSWKEELNSRRLKTRGWYGCIAPDGWRTIVEKTDEMLAHVDPDYEIQQVKEKFGTLRYYFTTVHEYGTIENSIMNAIVEAAETKSGRTCEVCGGPGETGWEKSWVRTLCEEHYEEEKD